MRKRSHVLWSMIALTFLASAVAVFAQNDSQDGETTLTFTAGSKIFNRREDGTFTNRFYKGVKTNHLDAILNATEGFYDSRTGEVLFIGETVFQDSTRDLYADTLIYNENTHEAIAMGNVRVAEGGRRLTARRVRYLKDLQYIIASGDVTVEDDSTHSTILGMTAEFNDSTGYGIITGNPFLRKVDDDGSVMTITCTDTLELLENEKVVRLWNNVVAIKDSMTMSCSDTLEIYEDNNSVSLWNNVVATMDSFSAKASFAHYDDIDETLSMTGEPEMTYSVAGSRDESATEMTTVSVVTGDSVLVKIHDRKVAGARVVGNAAATTSSTDSTDALFDRSLIESMVMLLEMTDDSISLISAQGTAQSYYHRNYPEDNKMFVNEASGDTLNFHFDKGKVTEMKIFGFGGGLGKGKYFDYELSDAADSLDVEIDKSSSSE